MLPDFCKSYNLPRLALSELWRLKPDNIFLDTQKPLVLIVPVQLLQADKQVDTIYGACTNLFLANVSILYPRKIPDNQRFSGVFRVYKTGTGSEMN